MSPPDNQNLNQKLWESWTRINVKSDFYDVEGFKRGGDQLDDVVVNGVGDVQNKTLLHLQCHFGLDTLSWARRGANVVGVDFSEEAIGFARKLASDIDIDARFIHCNIYDLAEHLSEEFDVVFTSHGVLGWLPDIEAWAAIIASHLKPGGRFFIAEIHPVAWMFDETPDRQNTQAGDPVFPPPGADGVRGERVLHRARRGYRDQGLLYGITPCRTSSARCCEPDSLWSHSKSTRFSNGNTFPGWCVARARAGCCRTT